MKLQIIFLILVVLTSTLIFETAFAFSEPILITQSPDMENVVFDGKWTNLLEWKPSSHNMFTFDNGKTVIHLRTAHYENYIYVFVDPVTDLTIDKNLDEAMICFDGENNKNKIHDENDFCFSVFLDTNQGYIFQGTNDNLNKMKKISNPNNFVAVSAVSDENDRYTKTPHPSYEFKIPIELLKRSDNYGFYLSVYDASSNNYFSYPTNSTREHSSHFPTPSSWGNIISPDKSLPELNLPILILVILFFTVILIQSKTKLGLLRTIS